MRGACQREAAVISAQRSALTTHDHDVDIADALLARAVDEFFRRRDRRSMERAAAESAKRYSWTEYGAIMSRLVTGT